MTLICEETIIDKISNNKKKKPLKYNLQKENRATRLRLVKKMDAINEERNEFVSIRSLMIQNSDPY